MKTLRVCLLVTIVAALGVMSRPHAFAAHPAQSAGPEVWINPSPVQTTGFIDVEGRNFLPGNISGYIDNLAAGGAQSFGVTAAADGTFTGSLCIATYHLQPGVHTLTLKDLADSAHPVSAGFSVVAGDGSPPATPVPAPWHTGAPLGPPPSGCQSSPTITVVPTSTPTVTAPPPLTSLPTSTSTILPAPVDTALPTQTATATPVQTQSSIAVADPLPANPTPTTLVSPVAESPVVMIAFYARPSRIVSSSMRVGTASLSITVQAARLLTSPVQLGWSISDGQRILAHHQIHTSGWAGQRTFTWAHVFTSPGSYIANGVTRFGGKTQVRALPLNVRK